MNTENLNTKEYSLDYQPDLFRYFLRKLYSEVVMSNEECDKVGKGFYSYLLNLNLTDVQKKNILPKNSFDVILNSEHPLKTFGFPPAFVFHFGEHIKVELG